MKNITSTLKGIALLFAVLISTNVSAQTCALTSGIVKVNPTCYGDCDGSVTANPAHGSGSYGYLWSNGETTKTISNLCANTYTVTITDLVTQCTITKTAIIKKGRVTGKFTLVNATCGDCNGSITAQGQGGNGGPFTYQWSTGETTATINNVCAGQNYYVTITDKLGCTFTCFKRVRNVGTPFDITPDVTPNTSCTNDCNGTASVTPNSGAIADYTYLWNTGAVTNSIEDLCAGSYTVTVTNASGCSRSETITVVDELDCEECDGDFTTYTQGGWANPGGPGQYMAANFENCFGSVVIGDPCGHTITLTTVQAVQDFLPQGGQPAALDSTYTDPGSDDITVLAGQVLGVTFALGFDDCDPDFGGSETDLGAQIYLNTNSPFYGWSIQAILDESNRILAGCASLYTPEDANIACTDINENYDEGGDDGLFTCPEDFNAPTRMSAQSFDLVRAFPNPFEDRLTFEINSSDPMNIIVTDLSGRVVERYTSVTSTFTAETNWKNGVYFVTFENETQSFRKTLKVIHNQ